MIETESTGLLTLYSDVRAAAVHWLWYPFIASGKITLLQGDPGDGKSTMMMRLIAELSTGGVTPDGCPLEQRHYAGNWDVLRPATELKEYNLFMAEDMRGMLHEAERIMEGWLSADA